MEKLKILHMYPNMLDLYGDSGNVEVLSYRCKMRGIELEVSKHLIGDKETDFTQYDIIYLGGGADFEQQILADDLVSCKDSIMEAYKAGTFFLMICGGYQLMGQYYKDSNGEKVPGLGLFDYYTVASTDKRCRCIGNIVIEAQLDGEKYKVIGFETMADRPPTSSHHSEKSSQATATSLKAVPRAIWKKALSQPISMVRSCLKIQRSATMLFHTA